MNETPSVPEKQAEPLDDGRSFLRKLSQWLRPSGGNGSSVREAFEELIEEPAGGDDAIDAHERSLLSNVLKQRNVMARDIMVPRADIIAVEIETPVVDVIELLVGEGHSRVPVYRKTLDDLIGFVHIKDLAVTAMYAEPDGNGGINAAGFDLAKVIRRGLVISPTYRVLDLLLEMRLKRTHMAAVVDEYGGVDGLITIEDVVEQIVGDIADEHDEDEEPEMIIFPDGTVSADARVTLRDFSDRFKLTFDEEEQEEVDTLGGLVFRLCGRIPRRKELVTHPSGLEIEITDADPQRVRRLLIRIEHPTPDTESS